MTELENRVAQYRTLGSVCIMGDFNIHIAEIPSTIMLDALNDHEQGTEMDDPLETAAVQLPRISVDMTGRDDPDDVPIGGTNFIDRMDNAGLIVTNGLLHIGDGQKAEATYGDSSVIDYILIDSDHWECMESVTVVEDSTARVRSDHQLITSALKYTPSPVNSSTAEGIPNNASMLISKTRYCTKSRGDPYYYDRYAIECGKVLEPLVTKWKEATEKCEPIGVEDAWADFHECVESIASKTIGTSDSQSKRHRNPIKVRRKGDIQLQVWRRQLKQIVLEKAKIKWTDHIDTSNYAQRISC